jgi:hypothetical protein
MDEKVGQAAHAPECRQQVIDAVSITSSDPRYVSVNPIGPSIFTKRPKELSQLGRSTNELIGLGSCVGVVHVPMMAVPAEHITRRDHLPKRIRSAKPI